MSIRSLIEINHDFTWQLDDPAFVSALRRYLASACSETAADLKGFGVDVISRRHHSGRYYVDPKTDGFPVETLPSDSCRTRPRRPVGDEQTQATRAASEHK